ncbi:MAG: dTDP-4-dehydrorhamnose reductase [Humidesulfovibrio sp.]|uniref:dTDP-4-dehydrorhamnose reductase n=1 Tax=Humidesulfovibrio sp. TaxID=2910988 RepID=UPI0027F78CC1|nr:dTDP-4-dehydrorhamnose reductase [Humidesulfovibrio sp.]MDQ7833791.1 dTDP-4-dehydrorhamnose reductase [Humidesulfovibrio sp.]
MSLPKRVLVLGGANGMLGRAVVTALASAGVAAVAASSEDVDYFDADDLADYLDELDEDGAEKGLGAVDCIVNAVAYTQVDKAEDQPEEAYKLNASMPALVGVVALERQLRLVHYSTDFVFDGKKGAPYLPTDDTNPLSVYGASKLAGEQALLALEVPGLLILRTAWLFGPGKMNFVRRILELAAERKELKVVADQFGSPTCTTDLARMTVELLDANATGLLHAVNSGEASWHQLASEAVRLAELDCRVLPIPTSGYPTRAVRPANSALDMADTLRLLRHPPRHWREALAEYVASFPTI